MAELSERPAIAQAPISVILLAQPLSTETRDVLQSWRRFFESAHRIYEILLVAEARPEAVDAASSQGETSRTFPYERANGYGAALGDALRAAQHPLIALCPCDQQYLPHELEHMLKSIDKVDLVVGYRVGKATPFWRLLLDTVTRILARVFIGIHLEPTECWLGSRGWGRRWVARWIFGVRVSDPDCPYRLARREVFERFSIQSRGSFVQIEMLAKVNFVSRADADRSPHLIAEEPVTWTPPEQAACEAVSFAGDAWRVFRHPQLGSGISLTQAGGSG